MKPLLCVSSRLLAAALLTSRASELSDAELSQIGRKVWINECDGTVAGLTSWNEGEAFASLGIGHFIWYPAGMRGPFEESFPPLARYLAAHAQPVPEWMLGACPWRTREDFVAAQDTRRMEELRGMLAATVPLQAQFIARRMRASLPKMLAAAYPAAAEIRRNFERLEAYRRRHLRADRLRQLQRRRHPRDRALQRRGLGPPPSPRGHARQRRCDREFSEAAKAMLERRVRNSPPARHEERWLPGWEARVDGTRIRTMPEPEIHGAEFRVFALSFPGALDEGARNSTKDFPPKHHLHEALLRGNLPGCPRPPIKPVMADDAPARSGGKADRHDQRQGDDAGRLRRGDERGHRKHAPAWDAPGGVDEIRAAIGKWYDTEINFDEIRRRWWIFT